jgi:serine/threonine protein phosphatase PrpC
MVAGDETVIIQGILSKQSSGALRRWQKRFFVLTGKSLVYYQYKVIGEDNYQKQKLGRGTQSGGIDVHSIRQFQFMGDKSEIAFIVKGSHFHVRAPDSQTAEKWLLALETVLPALVATSAEIYGRKTRPIEARATSINFVASQGLIESSDSSVALLHESTAPPNYFRSKYNSRQVLNMDRGGYGQSNCGTNFGCVFDGVSTGGKINVYAAQAFAEVCMKWLGQHHPILNRENCCEYASELFQMAQHRQHNPGLRNPAFDAEGGCATGSFAVFQRCANGSAIVHGAALGDAAAILVMENGTAKQLNVVSRIGDEDEGGGNMTSKRSDTGGQICMGGEMSGEPYSFCQQVHRGDFVILTTDGLTDNVAHVDVLPFVMSHTWFDTLVRDAPLPCPWLAQGTLQNKQRIGASCAAAEEAKDGEEAVTPHLPSVQDLRTFIEHQPGFVEHVYEPIPSLTSAVVSQRLFNYLGWVTRYAYEQEEDYFGVQSEYNDMMRKHFEEESKQRAEGTIEGRQPMPAEAKTYEAEMKKQEKAKRRLPCKTDDVIIVAMRPFHEHRSPDYSDEGAGDS